MDMFHRKKGSAGDISTHGYVTTNTPAPAENQLFSLPILVFNGEGI
jgi:hypothetical protein